MSTVYDKPETVIADRCAPAAASQTGLIPVEGTATQYYVVAVQAGLAVNADPTNAAHYGTVIGIATNSATSATVWVREDGRIVNTAWTWTPGATLYVGAGGALTETPPDVTTGSGWLQAVAVAINATTIAVRVGEVTEYSN